MKLSSGCCKHLKSWFSLPSIVVFFSFHFLLWSSLPGIIFNIFQLEEEKIWEQDFILLPQSLAVLWRLSPYYWLSIIASKIMWRLRSWASWTPYFSIFCMSFLLSACQCFYVMLCPLPLLFFLVVADRNYFIWIIYLKYVCLWR